MAGVPAHIKAIAEFSPVEDVVLPILRAGLHGIQVQSLIGMDQTFPLVLVRRATNGLSADVGDTRFVDSALIQVNVLVEDPNGDEDGAILAEAARVVLRDAKFKQTVVTGRGHIVYYDERQLPKRSPDWATATGPVQYADLPTGVVRYEATYQLGIRRPFSRPYPTP